MEEKLVPLADPFNRIELGIFRVRRLRIPQVIQKDVFFRDLLLSRIPGYPLLRWLAYPELDISIETGHSLLRRNGDPDRVLRVLHGAVLYVHQ
mgnify:CR=1 FL=1